MDPGQIRTNTVYFAQRVYSRSDLIGVEVKALRMPAVTKYRHPEDSALTWCGLGASKTPQGLVIA